jgi:hypothetical protein
MKLTEKDAAFLETLKKLMESKDLWVELKPDRPSYMVLKGTYGEKAHEAFRMSRQGVRWRFWRIMNEMYVSSFSTILFVEKTFGTELREHAMRISRERYDLRQQAVEIRFQSADLLASRRETQEPTPAARDKQLTRDLPVEPVTSGGREMPPPHG